MLGKLLKGVLKKVFMENKKERNEEPVIIRRAVIINDEDEKQEKKKKETAVRRESAFGAQKPKNKDYNIVYRDKPTKPLTVSELFGISKKEKKPSTTIKSTTEVKEVKVTKEAPVVEKEVVIKETPSEVKKVTSSNNKNNNQSFSNDRFNKSR